MVIAIPHCQSVERAIFLKLIIQQSLGSFNAKKHWKWSEHSKINTQKLNDLILYFTATNRKKFKPPKINVYAKYNMKTKTVNKDDYVNGCFLSS